MEISIELIAGVGIGLVIGLIIGYVVVSILDNRKIASLETAHRDQENAHRERVAELNGRLEQMATAQEIVDNAKEQLGIEFEATASKVLQNSNDQFLQLANENMGLNLERARNEFDQRHQQFQSLVQPLVENYGKLNPQIEALASRIEGVTSETSKLSGALTSNQQVGNWGEVQLRKIVEMAGMSEYSDFAEQQSVNGSRPDLIVKLPDDRAVVVDAKASLAAHLEATQAEDEESANAAWAKHARALRGQVDDLNRKAYGSTVPGSLNFVVMFVPGDQFLASALRGDSGLIEYAISKRVAIATPASLIAMLWAVANGWERVRLAQDAESIRLAGEEMHSRMMTFVNHYQRVGKGLRDAVDSYNRSIGSFDTRVVPQGRRFAELVKGDPEEFPTPSQIEADPQESRYVLIPAEEKTGGA